jgi:4-hydroxy-3-polyprenylbenzoate decarboxylase
MSLRRFITELEQGNDLRKISTHVSPSLELAAITDRICKAPGGGSALQFEQVTGYKFPVATNLFGSYSRIALALGASSLEDFGQQLGNSLQSTIGQNANDRLKNLLDDVDLQPVPDINPPCQRIIAKADLSLIPALKYWPQETIPSLTLPLIITADPDTGQQNCGMYRVQLHDAESGTINFGTDSGGAKHLKAWQERKQPMPVAIALGGDPALIWAAGAPLPKNCDELHMAAWITGRPQSITPCLSQPIQVPANAEFVIEGIIQPGESRAEGLFGNHTGGYVSNPAAPLFRVTAISHRRDAICPATLVGPPPMEDCYLAKASERLMLELLKIDYPQICELSLPIETIFHGCALLAVKGLKGGQGIELIRELWNDSQLKRSKLLILLDSDVDLRNPSLNYWRTVNLLEESRILTDRGRIGIDATGIDPATLVEKSQETTDLVIRRWSEYGLD